MTGVTRRYLAKPAAGMALLLVLAVPPAGAEREVREAVIAVRGMLCSSCAAAVEKALLKLDGVAEAHADVKGDRVVVRYDGEKVTPRQMAEAIRKGGYQARLPEERAPR